MRSKYNQVVFFFGMLLAAAGCGKEESGTPIAVVPPTIVASTEALPLPMDSSAAATVASDFLAATLKGDYATIRRLLTPQARRMAEENAVPFAPQANESATFTVDRTEPKGKIGAYVHSTVNSVDEQGRRESAEIVWIVALGEEGWRVAGAAVTLFEGQEKTVINFEDPESALQAITEAMKRRKDAEHIRQVRFNGGPVR